MLFYQDYTCFLSKGDFFGGGDLFSIGGGTISWYFRVGFQGCNKYGTQLILPSFYQDYEKDRDF